jgi:aspartyl-tRNA(Asn)/glutamyl-tRNA(Gln) amidotransferase subunit A
MLAEGFAIHEAMLSRKAQEYSDYTRGRLALGSTVSAADYVQAQRLRRELVDEYQTVAGTVDALVCGCTPTPAPDAEITADRVQKFFFLKAPVLAAPFNLTGAPAAAVCCGFTEDSLPIAMQVASTPRRDGVVLKVAHAYEQATHWRSRRPPEPGNSVH